MMNEEMDSKTLLEKDEEVNFLLRDNFPLKEMAGDLYFYKYSSLPLYLVESIEELSRHCWHGLLKPVFSAHFLLSLILFSHIVFEHQFGSICIEFSA